jgi:hypothetical protein
MHIRCSPDVSKARYDPPAPRWSPVDESVTKETVGIVAEPAAPRNRAEVVVPELLMFPPLMSRFTGTTASRMYPGIARFVVEIPPGVVTTPLASVTPPMVLAVLKAERMAPDAERSATSRRPSETSPTGRTVRRRTPPVTRWSVLRSDRKTPEEGSETNEYVGPETVPLAPRKLLDRVSPKLLMFPWLMSKSVGTSAFRTMGARIRPVADIDTSELEKVMPPMELLVVDDPRIRPVADIQRSRLKRVTPPIWLLVVDDPRSDPV